MGQKCENPIRSLARQRVRARSPATKLWPSGLLTRRSRPGRNLSLGRGSTILPGLKVGPSTRSCPSGSDGSPVLAADQKRRPCPSPKTLAPFRSPSLSFPQCRDGERRQRRPPVATGGRGEGAAAGPLAGARACPRVSAQSSSGLVATPLTPPSLRQRLRGGVASPDGGPGAASRVTSAVVTATGEPQVGPSAQTLNHFSFSPFSFVSSQCSRHRRRSAAPPRVPLPERALPSG